MDIFVVSQSTDIRKGFLLCTKVFSSSNKKENDVRKEIEVIRCTRPWFVGKESRVWRSKQTLCFEFFSKSRDNVGRQMPVVVYLCNVTSDMFIEEEIKEKVKNAIDISGCDISDLSTDELEKACHRLIMERHIVKIVLVILVVVFVFLLVFLLI